MVNNYPTPRNIVNLCETPCALTGQRQRISLKNPQLPGMVNLDSWKHHFKSSRMVLTALSRPPFRRLPPGSERRILGLPVSPRSSFFIQIEFWSSIAFSRRLICSGFGIIIDPNRHSPYHLRYRPHLHQYRYP